MTEQSNLPDKNQKQSLNFNKLKFDFQLNFVVKKSGYV